MTGLDPYISLSEAARNSGYTAEYLRQLCVKGKLDGQKIGKSWVTTAASVDNFKQGQLPLPPTLAEIAGTSVFSYAKAQKLLATTVALIVFFPVFAQLTRLPDRVNYLSNQANALVAATQDSVNHRLQHYLAHLLGLDNGIVSGTSTTQISYPYNFIGPRQILPNSSVAVKAPAPTISNSALVNALRSLLAVGLPDDVRMALQGPPGVAGPAGPAGAAGPAGPAGYSGTTFVVPTGPTSSNSGGGTLGGTTFGSSDQFVTRLLTATGTSTLVDTNITGNLTVTGNFNSTGTLTLTGDLLPGTDNIFNLGSTTKRWADLHTGPAGLIVHNDATDTNKVSLVFSGANAILATDTATPLQITTGANPGINILTSGRVGIGTTSPSFLIDAADAGAGTLDVARLQNTVAAADNSGSELLFASNRTTGGLTNVAGVSGLITDITDAAYKGALVFSTANNAAPAERMRIDNVGNVSINTTAASGNLDIRQIANNDNIIYSRRNTDTLPTGNFLDFRNAAGSTSLFSVDTDGALTVAGTTTLNGLVIANGSMTSNAQATFTKVPTLAHVFSPWPTGTSNGADGTVYINPASSEGDGNLITAAVGGVAQFLVDAEGDIYGNNLILAGSTTTGQTTVAGNLSVQDSTILGDASTDLITPNGGFDNNIRLLKTNTATAVTQYPSYDVRFQASSWDTTLNGGAGGESTNNFVLRNIGQSGAGAAYRLGILNDGAASELVSVLQSGNVGIGTTAPGRALHVYGLTDPAIIIQDSYSAGWDIQASQTFGGLNFAERGVADGRLFLKDGGNVGIGTTGPAAKLDVKGTVQFNGTSGGADVLASFLNSAGVNKGYLQTNSTNAYVFLTGNANDFAISSNNAGNVPTGAYVYLQNSSGNVGIGTTGPGAKLDIQAAAVTEYLQSTTGTNAAYTRWQNTGGYLYAGMDDSTGATILSSGSMAYAGVINMNSATNPLILATNNAGRMTITPTGNVGIGMTAPGAKLDVSNGLTAQMLAGIAVRGAAGGTSNSLEWGHANAAGYGSSLGFYSSLGNPYLAFNGEAGTTINTFRTRGIQASIILSDLAGGMQFGNVATASADNQTFAPLVTILSGGNVGIGTTAPSDILELNSTAPALVITATSDKPRILFQIPSTAKYGHLGYDTTDDAVKLVYDGSFTGSVKGINIKSTGNVGIGTTGPGQLLHVRKDQNADTAIKLQNATAGTGSYTELNGQSDAGGVHLYAFSSLYTTSGQYIANSAQLEADAGLTNGFVLAATGNAPIALWTNANERMRILGNGNVGIGTTGPLAKLQVSDVNFSQTVDTNNTGGANLSIRTTNAQSATVGGSINLGGMYSTTDSMAFGAISGRKENSTNVSGRGYLAFSATNGDSTVLTERMRIDSNGNVGIGTTGPGSKLDVTTAGLAATQTTSSGLALVNTTAATALAPVQISPAVRWSGFGWKTDATAASQAVDFRSYVVPVQGTANPTGYLSFGSSVNGGAYSDGQLVLTTGGNVGIGTTGPLYKLEIHGSGAGADPLQSTANVITAYDDRAQAAGVGGQIVFAGTWQNNGAQTAFAGIRGVKLNGTTFNDSGQLEFFTRNNGVDDWTGQQRMVIDNLGNVGIGTTAPSYKLDLLGVSGDVARFTDGTYSLRAYLGSDYKIFQTNNGDQFGYQGTEFYATSNGGTEAMRIKAGNVGIGTTSFVADEKLRILNSSGTDYNPAADVPHLIAAFSNTTAGALNNAFLGLFTEASGEVYLGAVQDSGNTGADFAVKILDEGNGRVERFRITHAGNVGIGTTGPGSKLDVTTAGLAATQTTSSGLALVNTTAATAIAPVQISPAVRWSGFGWKTDVTAGSQAVDFRSYVVPVQGTANPTGYLAFESAINGGAYSATPAFVITSAGNIGIGTTGPGSKLEVNVASSVFTRIGGDDSAYNKPYGIYYTQADSGLNNSANLFEMVPVTTSRNNTLMQLHSNETGATSYLLRATYGNTASSPTSTAFVIQSTGNVGIGTTGPTEKLQVSGPIVSTDASVNWQLGDAGALLQWYTGNIAMLSAKPGSGGISTSMQFHTANSGTTGARMTIDNLGNVGIGTTGPGMPLHVVNTAATNNIAEFISASTGENNIFVGNSSSAATVLGYYATAPAYGYMLLAGSTRGTQSLNINAAGNVGIGNTAPLTKLQIGTFAFTGGDLPSNGAITANINSASATTNTDNGYQLTLTESSALGANKGGAIGFQAVYDGSSNVSTIAGIKGLRENATVSNQSGYLQFLTRGASGSNIEWMRITSTGTVGIGTTVPGDKLHIYVASGNVLPIVETASGNAAGFVYKRLGGNNYFTGNSYSASNVYDVVYDITSGASRIAVSSTGNVGIGTTSPVYGKLQIDSNAVGEGLALFNGNNSFRIFSDSATTEKLNFSVGTAVKMVIDTTGNVGIGTTSPAYNLDIRKTGAVGTYLRIDANDADAGGYGANLLFRSKTAGAVSNQWQVGTNVSDNANSLAFYDGTNYAMVMKIGGNVGIGTTGPLGRLDVRSDASGTDITSGGQLVITNANATSNNLAGFGFSPDGSSPNYAALGARFVRGGAQTATQLYFATINTTGSMTERVTIDQAGNVGIGTTGPAARLHVEQNQNGESILLVKNTNSGASAYAELNLQANSPGLAYFRETSSGNSAGANKLFIGNEGAGGIRLNADNATGAIDFLTGGNATARMTIDTSGNVGIGNASPKLKLDVYGGAGASGAPASSGTTPTGYTVIGSGFNNNLYMGSMGNSPYAFWLQVQDSSALGTNYPLALQPNGGNVGIGTTGPLYKLDVANGQYRFGSQYTAASTGYGFMFNNALTAAGGGAVGVSLRNDLTAAANSDLLTQVNNDGATFAKSTFTGLTASIIRLVGGNMNASGTGTIDNASALWITGAPTIGTNNYAIKVDAGVSTFGGNVGIGTTSPTSTALGADRILDIGGTATPGLALHSTNSAQEISFGGGGNGMYFDVSGHATATNNIIVFRTEETNSQFTPTERMRIDSIGNVGIGTTGPWAKLTVGDTSGTSQSIAVTSSGHVTGYLTANSGNYTELASDTGSIRFANALGGTANMTILNTGNVGIGTTSPGDLLHVYKGASGVTPHPYTTVDIENSDSNAIELMTPNTKGSWIFFSDPEGASGQIDYSHVTDAMTLSAGGLDALVLQSDQDVIVTRGNVGIGTTGPGALLQVNGNVILSGGTLTQGVSVNINGAVTASGGIQRGYQMAGSQIAAANNDIIEGMAVYQSITAGAFTGLTNYGVHIENPSGTGTIATNYGLLIASQTRGTTNYAIYSTGGTNYFGGNVGIGTTGPLAKLQVNVTGDTNNKEFAYFFDPDLATDARQSYMLLGKAAASGESTLLGHLYKTTTTLSGAFLGNYGDQFTQGLFVQKAGNVGIGTTAPGARLDIVDSASTGAAIRLREGTTNGTEYVGLKAPDAITTSVTYVLPSADGTVGQILQTSGAGVLSWTANSASGMANPMTTTGDIIYASDTASPSTPARLAIGTAGQCLLVTTGLPAWGACSGSSAAAGADTQIQYNNAGSFGASANFIWNNTNKTLSVTGTNTGAKVSLALLNDSTGTGASNELRIGNDAGADTLTLAANSSAFTSHLNEASIFNRTTGASTGGAGALTFGTSNTERVRIDSAGNVGIGTTAPGYALDVTGSTAITSGLIVGSPGGLTPQSGGQIDIYGTTASIVDFIDASPTDYDGRIRYEHATRQMQFYTTQGQRMVIDTGGNVGIGTTAPSGLLHLYKASATVALNMEVDDVQSAQIRLGTMTDGAESLKIGMDRNNNWGYIDIPNSAGKLIMMQSGGNVGIGTTGPLFPLVVKAATNQNIAVRSNIFGVTGVAIQALNDAQDTNQTLVLAGSQINLMGGNVGIGTTAPGTKFVVNLAGANQQGAINLLSGASGNYASYGLGRAAIEFEIGIAAGVAQFGTGTVAGDTALFTHGGKMHFGTDSGGTQTMTISGGNVGIGTTGPSGVLHIMGAPEAALLLNKAGASGGRLQLSVGDGTTVDNFAYVADESYIGTVNNNLHFISSSGNVEYVTFGMAGATAGNVGIGTTAPTQKLHIYGSGTPTVLVQNSGASVDAALVLTESNSAAYGAKLWWEGLVGYAHLDNLYNSANARTDFRMTTSGTPLTAMSITGTGNVGIGTTAPIYTLDVAGNIAGTSVNASGAGLFYWRGRSQMVSGADGDWEVQDQSAVPKLSLKSGNVGIGQTVPTSKLDVTTAGLAATQTTSSGLALVNTTAATALAPVQISPAIRWSGFGWKTDVTAASQAVDFRSYVVPVQGTANPTGYLSFGSSVNGGAYSDGQLVLTTGGNVGIGTTSPAQKLDVNGNIALSPGNGLVREAGGNALITPDDNVYGAKIYANSGGGILFGQGTTELMRITSAGNVGIGTTVPGVKLDIQATDGTSRILVRDGSSSRFTAGDDAGAGGFMQLFNDAGSATHYFRGDGNANYINAGNLGIGTTAPGVKLHVVGPTLGTAARFSDNTNGTLDIRFPVLDETNLFANSANMSFTNQSGEVMRLSAGNVGIGTTGPGTKLHVEQTAAASTAEEIARFTVSDDSGGYLKINNFTTVNSAFSPQVNGYYNGATLPGLTLFADALTDTGTVALMQFKSTVAGGAVATRPLFQWLENATPVMTIDSTGNAGIGTTSPGARLNVIGADSLNTSFAGNISGATGTGLVITNAGNVGIGTTDPGGYKLATFGGDVKVTGGTNTRIIVGDSTSDSDYGQLIWNTASNYLGLDTDNTVRPLILQGLGGNVGIGTTAPGSKLDVTTAGLAATQTTSSGLALVNTTAATALAPVQISPAIRWSGFGWKTDATAASQAVDFRSYVVPVQGTANPTGYLSFGSSVNGGAYSDGQMVLTTAGNVGIGSTSPGSRLSVHRAAASSAISSAGAIEIHGVDGAVGELAELQFVNGLGGLPHAVIGVVRTDASVYETGDLYFATKNGTTNIAATERMRITSTGNVGIGTTTPANLLHLNVATAGGLPRIQFTNSDTGVIASDGSYVGLDAAENLNIQNLEATDMYFGTSATNRMRISAAGGLSFGSTYISTDAGANKAIFEGNVGIGTTNPATFLHLKGQNVANRGQLTIEATDYAQISMYNGSTYVAALYQDVVNNVLTIGTRTSGGQIDFAGSTGGTSAIRIDASGNVGIGTTGPGSKLDITTAGLAATQTASSGLALVNTTAATALAPVQISPAIRWSGFGWKTDATAASQAVDFRSYVVPVQGTANPTGYLAFGSSVNGAAYSDGQMVLTTGGNVGIGTTAPGAKLDVNGLTRIYDQTAVTGVSTLTIRAGAGQATGPTHLFDIFANDGTTARFHVTDTGSVGIGTTGPAGKLDVEKDTANIADTLYLLNSSTVADTGSSLNFADPATAKRSGVIGSAWTTTGTTDGYLAFTTRGSNALAERMRIDNTGNVGIGTTSPSALLDIGSGTPTTAASGLMFGTDTAANLYRSAAGTIKTDGSLTVTGAINKTTITAPTTAATLAFGTDNATVTFQGTDTYIGRTTTDTLTNKTLSSSTDVIGGVTMTLGSDATGDVYYRAAGGALTRLAIGAATTLLHGGTTPSYSALSLTADVSGLLPLTSGGTNANLTASNGGIIYSDASKMQVLSGTATVNQVLLSGAAAAPAWSTAAYPATTTANQLLYSSANNVIGGLSTTSRAVLTGNSSGVPAWIALADGQIVIGSTAGSPTAASITGTANQITVTAGSGSITLSTPQNIDTGAAPTFARLTLTPADDATGLTLTGGSITGLGTTPFASVTGTWNTTAAPTAIKLNVTDTASNTASLLLDLQVGGVSKASITKAGNMTLAGNCADAAGGGGCTADYAEVYTAQDGADLQPGDVVALDGNGKVIKALTTPSPDPSPQGGGESDTLPFGEGRGGVVNMPIGIYSTTPGMLIGTKKGISIGSGSGTASQLGPNEVPVALAGRVPVKVSEENGQIRVGDRLTVSKQLPGYAAKMINSGQSIAIALEDFDAAGLNTSQESGLGTIMAFVSIGYQHIDVAVNATGDKIVYDKDVDMGGMSILNVKAIASMSGKWAIADDGTVTAARLVADSAEIGKLKITGTTGTTIGRDKILAGSVQVVITNDNVTAQSAIFVTFRGDFGGRYWIDSQTAGSFTVKISQAPTADLPFDYWIVGTDQGQLTGNVQVPITNDQSSTNDQTITGMVSGTTTPPADTTTTSDTAPTDTTTAPTDTTTTPVPDATATTDTSTAPAPTDTTVAPPADTTPAPDATTAPAPDATTTATP